MYACKMMGCMLNLVRVWRVLITYYLQLILNGSLYYKIK